MIFDNGDILYDASVWRRWLHGELLCNDVRISFDDMIAAWETALLEVYQGRVPYWERFEAFILAMNVKCPSAIIKSAKAKAIDVQQVRHPMPGVKETIPVLRQRGVRLAVLSDTEGGEAAVREILRQLEIEQFFDVVVASSDIGFTKPDPKAFEHAVRALKLNFAECAFVAHDADELAGAKDVGLFAIAFNDAPAAPRDATVNKFSELLEYSI